MSFGSEQGKILRFLVSFDRLKSYYIICRMHFEMHEWGGAISL